MIIAIDCGVKPQNKEKGEGNILIFMQILSEFVVSLYGYQEPVNRFQLNFYGYKFLA